MANGLTGRGTRTATAESAGGFRATRARRGDRSGVDEPRRWRARPLIWVLTTFTILAALAFLLWLAWSLYVLIHGAPSHYGFDLDRRCATLSFSCGALSNFATSGLLIAIASAFVLWRLYLLLGRYQARARNESRELVPTAGTILDQVVGRDELCKVLMADLHDRRTRPHVLVGGVGTGKTAVLVRLTEFLADEGAVPVPIRLRDSGPELDFENLARDRFLSEVNQYVLNSAEGETIWRRLRKDGKIVVLADGLEEALIGTSAELERDNIIRAAIRKAHQQRLPLVIASRPHDPLRATEAAILVLEPLSYEAALAYIGSDGTREDDRRLAWIVETADVVEAPLYLQITRELHVKGLLEPSTAGQQGVVDTRGADRATLRLGLLQTWERALIRGHLYEDVPLNRAERQAAVEHMSALACTGLRHDRLDVEFDDPIGDQIAAEVQRRLTKIDEQVGRTPGVGSVDVRLAAAWAAQLELVELRGNSVRFPHSLMQAYLGSRLLDAALLDPGYRREALGYPQPGREFLIALVLHSRAARQAESPAAGSRPPPVPHRPAAGPPGQRAQRRAERAGRARPPARGRRRPRRQQGPGHVRGRPRDRLRRGRARAHRHRRADQEPVVPDPRARSQDPGGGQARAGAPLRRGGAHDRRPAARRRALRRRAGLSAALRDRLPRAVLPGPARHRAGDRGRGRCRLPGAAAGAHRAVPGLRGRAGRQAHGRHRQPSFPPARG